MSIVGTVSSLIASRATQLGKLALCYFGAWVLPALLVEIGVSILAGMGITAFLEKRFTRQKTLS